MENDAGNDCVSGPAGNHSPFQVSWQRRTNNLRNLPVETEASEASEKEQAQSKRRATRNKGKTAGKTGPQKPRRNKVFACRSLLIKRQHVTSKNHTGIRASLADRC